MPYANIQTNTNIPALVNGKPKYYFNIYLNTLNNTYRADMTTKIMGHSHLVAHLDDLGYCCFEIYGDHITTQISEKCSAEMCQHGC